MKILDKIKLNIILLWHSLFYAMKAGDKEIFQTSNGSSDSEINNHITISGVMNDLLNQEETEQVKELRDEYYRILKEADKYKVDVVLPMSSDGDIDLDENLEISATVRKKTSSDFSKHCLVDESDGLKVKLIQDNKHIEMNSENTYKALNSKGNIGIWDYETILDIDWGGIIPRFSVNKFITKIVIKELNNTESIVELYTPINAGQFSKLDAIFISELNKIFSDEYYKSDIKDIKGLKFITDKAWNSDNLCLFSYDNVKYEGISVYDGNFVIRYKCHIISEFESITKKFETKELDKKYETNAPKKDATDIFAIDRSINNIDFRKQKLKIE